MNVATTGLTVGMLGKIAAVDDRQTFDSADAELRVDDRQVVVCSAHPACAGRVVDGVVNRAAVRRQLVVRGQRVTGCDLALDPVGERPLGCDLASDLHAVDDRLLVVARPRR